MEHPHFSEYKIYSLDKSVILYLVWYKEKHMNQQEKKLYDSKNPKEYIENSVKSKLPAGKKAQITKQWLEKSGYTIKDIQQARSKHPYWQKKKSQGSAERNKARMEKNNYSNGKTIAWDKALLKQFITLNKKDKSGKYVNTDVEIAKTLKTTIPSIQYLRRKHRLVTSLINKKVIKDKDFYDYMLKSEEVLKALL